MIHRGPDFGGGGLGEALDQDGYAILPGLVDPATCAAIAKLYDGDVARFRKTVSMQAHGFGRGEYRYFARPLPEPVRALREGLYPTLAEVAGTWSERLGFLRQWPPTLDELTAECALAGQNKPTPLLLKYGPGDYNRLHQDIYGDFVFPLQVIVLLDSPGRDFTGGELILTEGRARMQSRPIVVPLGRGDAAVIPVRERPVAGARGWSRAAMRHGVSEVRSGFRRSLGLIFHDAA